MMDDEIKHLEWIYGRMANVHGENINFDYMIKFKKIIDEQKEVNEKIKKFEQSTKLNKSK
jgi:uncharacterized protein YdcH (DUF465 family)